MKLGVLVQRNQRPNIPPKCLWQPAGGGGRVPAPTLQEVRGHTREARHADHLEDDRCGRNCRRALFIGSGLAFAHPVGEADDPNCHGQRVSHGASHSKVHEGHGLTPVERRDLVEEIFGEELTVGEWNKFIKTCPPPPEQPPA